MKETYYTFEIAGSNVGFFVLKETANHLYMKPVFMIDGQKIQSPFEVKYDGDRPTSFRKGDDTWHSMEPYAEEAYPMSFWPVLIPKVEGQLVYQAINEGDGELLGETTLIKDEEHIQEKQGERTVREFWFDGHRIYKVDWGGAISRLCDSYDEAVKGSWLEKLDEG